MTEPDDDDTGGFEGFEGLDPEALMKRLVGGIQGAAVTMEAQQRARMETTALDLQLSEAQIAAAEAHANAAGAELALWEAELLRPELTDAHRTYIEAKLTAVREMKKWLDQAVTCVRKSYEIKMQLAQKSMGQESNVIALMLGATPSDGPQAAGNSADPREDLPPADPDSQRPS